MFRSEHATVGWPAHVTRVLPHQPRAPATRSSWIRAATRWSRSCWPRRSWASTSWFCTRAPTWAPVGDDGIDAAAESLSEVHERTRGLRVRLLLEVTAGQGSCLGCRFDDMAAMLDRARGGDTLGICFDTCHAHAAGLDLSTEEGYERAFDDFTRTVGLDRLRAFHLNDSKTPAGSRVDRHAEIGDGYLGLLPFWRLVNDPRFATVPGVLETPSGPDKQPSFARNLARLRALIGAPRPPGPPKSQALPDRARPAPGAAVRGLTATLCRASSAPRAAGSSGSASSWCRPRPSGRAACWRTSCPSGSCRTPRGRRSPCG